MESDLLLTLNLTSHQSYRSDACFPHTLLPPPVCLSRQTSAGAKYSRPLWPGNPPGFQPRRSEFPSPFAPARYFAARLRRSFVPAAAMFDVTPARVSARLRLDIYSCCSARVHPYPAQSHNLPALPRSSNLEPFVAVPQAARRPSVRSKPVSAPPHGTTSPPRWLR